MNKLICNWKGISGQTYKYEIFSLDESWNQIPANYIFAKQFNLNSYKAVYVGQTNNMNRRMSEHEKIHNAIRLGATHIHAHVASDLEIYRTEEERDLILTFNPPLNEKI